MRVAVIGCGTVAPTHLRALWRLRGVEVAALCDHQEARAVEMAREFQVPRIYTDPAELLVRERPDAVHVLTPPATHRDLTLQALRQGAHVLVEKPMALDTDEADEMVDAARSHRRSLAVCHNFLFDPAIVDALRLAKSGRIGRILSVDAYWSAYRDGRPDRYAHNDWMRRLPGGPIHELAPHAVYVLQAFLGSLSIVNATARSIHELPAPCEEAHVVFAGESALASASLSLSSRPNTITVRVHGTETSVTADIIRHRAVAAGIKLPHTRRGVRRPRTHPGHDTLVARFYESVRTGDRPPVTAADGRAVVSVLDRLWSELDAEAVS